MSHKQALDHLTKAHAAVKKGDHKAGHHHMGSAMACLRKAQKAVEHGERIDDSEPVSDYTPKASAPAAVPKKSSLMDRLKASVRK